MKRRMFCALLALCTVLCGIASAASIGIEELRSSAPGRWQKIYTAHGREIVVDVEIETPNVSTFPILTVRKPTQKLPDSTLESFTKIYRNAPGHITVRMGKEFNSVAQLGQVKQKQRDLYRKGQ